MTQAWPAVSYDRWAPTCDTLHAHIQVLGKLAIALSPPEPQLQHGALRLTARGWETAPLPAPDGSGSLVVALDLRSHQAVAEHSDGHAERVPLTPDRPVADVTREVLAAVARLGGAVRINPAPQEVPWDVPLDEDYEHARYDPGQVRDYFAAATQAALVLAAFRAPYRGRSTPVNAWWGAFDLAVALFSGASAEPPATDFIMRNSGDAEQFMTGWWPGDARHQRRGLLRLRLPEATRVRGRRPVPGCRALGPEHRRVHPGLGRRPRRPGPARGGAGVRPLGVPALLRGVPMAPRPARQHRGQPAARQVSRAWLALSRQVKLRRVNPHGRRDQPTELMDRFAERDALGRLTEAVRAGQGRALVLRGDPGVGKTALLSHLDRQAAAAGCRVAHAMGMQSEMELAFAGLHQLCAPMLSRAERLPGPQQDALRTALGLAAGPPPDRFLVGLAVLSLLSAEAGERPLLCLVDDEQWLDRASAQALGFAARRLAADPVGLVFAAREPSAELAGLPELEVTGLRDEDARALLTTALAGPLDARVRDLIVAETRGNPLALLELPRGLSPAELAGGFGLPSATPLAGRIEDSFTRQLDTLPVQTRLLLLVAAADPSGDQSLVWRAAARLGIPVQASAPAVEAGLAEFGGRVRFRHPLTRSAAYRSASLAQRQQTHAALAEVTDPITDPDRRAWHRAQAAPGPDEDVSAELERSAGRAQARGGLAAAAAFLQRSVALSADPGQRTGRALAAAEACLSAGAYEPALAMLAVAESSPLDDLQRGRMELLHGMAAYAQRRGSDAPPLLLKAAKTLETLDPQLARDTYLDAWSAALFAGKLATAGSMYHISAEVLQAPPAAEPLVRPTCCSTVSR